MKELLINVMVKEFLLQVGLGIVLGLVIGFIAGRASACSAADKERRHRAEYNFAVAAKRAGFNAKGIHESIRVAEGDDVAFDAVMFVHSYLKQIDSHANEKLLLFLFQCEAKKITGPKLAEYRTEYGSLFIAALKGAGVKL